MCFSLLSLASHALSGVHDDYATDQYIKLLNENLRVLNNAGPQNGKAAELLHIEFFETQERLKNIAQLESLGQSYGGTIRAFLRDKYLPALNAVYQKWNIKPDAKPYDAAKIKAANELKVAEAELAATFRDMQRRSPLTRRLLQYLSLSRSETIATGIIGDWNPDAPGAIQSSALSGVRYVLNEMERPEVRGRNLTVDTLLQWQGAMLGKAAHFFSQPGRINDIVFQQADGRRVHVRDHLATWQRELAARPANLVAANEAYWMFLHLHPFGDANGRIAELARHYILAKADLPPVLTREKVAIENYKFQAIFGRGNVDVEHTQLARETRDFMLALDKTIGAGKIVGLDLAGGSVVVQVERGGETRALVISRVHTLDTGKALPPVTGTPVVVGKASDLSLRVTNDSWKTQVDVKPAAVVETRRLSETKLSYAIYEVAAPNNPAGNRTSFAYFYDHPNGRVWFNNDGANYTAVTVSPGPCNDIRQDLPR